jgi:hypothetical protein
METVADRLFHMNNKPLVLGGKTATILDMWNWAYSNINNNTDRGVLAQYIVAWAAGVDTVAYVSWRGHDLDLPSGKRVEVKATARAQSWRHGKKLTKEGKLERRPARFSIKRSTDTDDDTKPKKGEAKTRHSDIYALCYYAHDNDLTMDATDLSHWKFWILSQKRLEEILHGRDSVLVSELESVEHPIDVFEIKDRLNEL